MHNRPSVGSPSAWLPPEMRYMHAYMLSRFSHVRLCATPWTAAHQASLPTGFSRQEYWSGFPCLSAEMKYNYWKKICPFLRTKNPVQWNGRLCEPALSLHGHQFSFEYVKLPGKFQRRELLGPRENWLDFHFSLSCIGEGNGNPLQSSCLENPRDGEPVGLPSMGLHRVGHDWSDLAAAAEKTAQIVP